jgi:UDP-N-acetylmuramate dehydrogenase
MRIEENVPLSSLTTFRTGGPARFLILLDSKDELRDASRFSREKSLPLIPLGGGSNLLAPDEGVEAVFVKLASSTIEHTEDGAFVAQGGARWDDLVARAVSQNAWGIENLSGIPGTVGAAAVQNIGAYGAALSDTVSEVQAFDLRDGSAHTFRPAECRFGYRTSIFKEERDRYFITSVSFRLSKTPRPNLSYRDLANRFAGMTPTLAEIRAAVIEIRKGKFPSLSEYGTAGSFFLNPVVTREEAAALQERYPLMPVFALPEGGTKVPLGFIFDKVLALKGMREEKAFVWEQQALVLATEAGARAADVRVLAEKITRMTKEATGIAITPEVRALS